MLKNIDYDKIIEAICYVKGIKRHESLKISKDRECKYILFLLLKKYKCGDAESVYKKFLISSKRAVNYGLKKAEEQFFINKEFREMYFEIENVLKE
ncbi:ribose-5-phosphate isomerase [Clostridium algoriphilum]|uniref:ribose-5-phosphate isomerase n=1 Tax=Clostridium algoriphilum TaxID=198347 RepID=UPI001CF243AD|nr:ribose-5-phosphate isomerase [Clostridium algoriphilum]MCB2293155.1 ribose-5-phosphate isomerase [Clostridium algoriphilum]